VREGIGGLIIGKNDGWKQDITLGRRTNLNFVQVPHARFIEMLQYKAALAGIEVRAINESHTSKCSFLVPSQYAITTAILAGARSAGCFAPPMVSG